jgi:hypothetical protein
MQNLVDRNIGFTMQSFRDNRNMKLLHDIALQKVIL